MTAKTPSTSLGRRERIDRMRSRSWALHVLYRWEAGGESAPLEEVLEDLLRTRTVAPRRVARVTRLVGAVSDHRDAIDDAIRTAMDNWRLQRLSVIDRSVLRIATAELLSIEDTPPKVAIQEGVRLAGQYGGDESPRFVNGVLDAIYRASGRAT